MTDQDSSELIKKLNAVGNKRTIKLKKYCLEMAIIHLESENMESQDKVIDLTREFYRFLTE